MCICRTALERQRASYKQAVNEVTSTVVTAVRRRYQHAFSGLTDLQRALVAIVPHSCVSTAAITRDYQSQRHRDSESSALEGSCPAWPDLYTVRFALLLLYTSCDHDTPCKRQSARACNPQAYASMPPATFAGVSSGCQGLCDEDRMGLNMRRQRSDDRRRGSDDP